VRDKVPGSGDFGRMLIIIGAVLVVLGLLFSLEGRLFGLGRLPGDIVIRRGNFTFYFPLMTSILLSLGLTVLLWLLRRR
jgi:hypothetical protein